MTNTICGHNRDVLRMALEDLAHVDSGTIVELARIPEALPEWRNAVLDLIDPAKLAAMMAWELRRLRVGVMHRGVAAKLSYPMVIVDHNERVVRVQVQLTHESDVIDVGVTTMSQAHVLLLQWMQLPDGAREKAERVLRGELLRDPRVDWTNDLRPAVLGGECARCFYRAPLHEPGCVMLKCVAPNPCACCKCFKRGETCLR